jgi:hypothetical protein
MPESEVAPSPARSSHANGSTPRARLSLQDRHIVLCLAVLAVLATCYAVVHALAASLTFFGEATTARDRALTAHSLRAALFAAATPMCAAAVLRQGRRRGVVAGVWLVLVLLAAPWRSLPQNEATYRSAWLEPHPGAALLWLLLIGGVATGLRAWRTVPAEPAAEGT